MGHYTGFYSSEWCQETQKNYARITGWPGEPSLAMTRSDFTPLGEGEHRIAKTEDLITDTMRYLSCKCRHQKNDDNGEKITFSGNISNREYCIVAAGLRI